jgi:membrane protease YdiL (CAAX protease family)
MRVRPRPLITLGLVVGYLVIIGASWAVVGLNYDEVGDSTSTIVKGMVIPVFLGAIYLTLTTSYLGWWGPAIRESLRAPRWLWVVPALMVLPGLGFVLGGAPSSDRSVAYLLVLAVGTLLVGFSEELLCRGTGLVWLRGGYREPLAWALCCLLFGLIHALNAFFGQSLGTTLQQIVIAFLAGSVLYITRRVSGTLVLCVLLHAWVDFTGFGFSKAAQDAQSPFTLLAVGQFGAFLLALVGVVVVLRRGAAADTGAVEAHATA